MTGEHSKIEKTIRNSYIQHMLFWIVSFYILIRLFAYSEEIEKVDIIYTFLFHFSLVFVVYVNLRVLIPKYLQKKKYLLYLFGLLTVAFQGLFLNMATFNWFSDWMFPGYYFIDYYSFIEILEFILVYILITSLLKFSKGWFENQELNQLFNSLQKAKLDSEISALKAQINPHFFFNSLNNLYSLSLDEDKRVPDIILRLAEMMRYLLYETNAIKVTLEKELDHLKNFIEMQSLRADKIEHITFTVVGATKNISVVPLLFLPLVENAFKHGRIEESAPTSVRFFLEIGNDELLFKTENRKKISSDKFNDNSSGVGLINLKKRLQLSYPNKHKLIITDGIDHFSTILKISLT